MSSESTLIITAVPDFVSPEEHRNIVASTPSSFSDIRPVLRHKQDNVAVKLDPPLEAFTPEDGANGVLYVIERCADLLLSLRMSVHKSASALVFMSSTGRGFQVKYPAITLHAISRGDAPSIYCQLDETDNSSPPDESSEDVPMRELTIVPQDPGSRTSYLRHSIVPAYDSISQWSSSLKPCPSVHPCIRTQIYRKTSPTVFLSLTRISRRSPEKGRRS